MLNIEVQPSADLDQDLAEMTIAASRRDQQTVTDRGQPVGPSLHGVAVRPAVTHVDDRGTLTEIYDPRWNFHPEPMIYCYTFTIRPGHAKGWAIHRLHDDRYFILQGSMELVLYDVRPDSPTKGTVARYRLSDYQRCLINIPAYVWHAERNLGERDFVGINFPTMQYDHANPDKYRLPLDTPLIPFSFGGTPGW